MTTLLLERLLNCKESTNFIIIEDSIIQSGYVLLKEFIKRIAMNQYVLIAFFSFFSTYFTYLLIIYVENKAFYYYVLNFPQNGFWKISIRQTSMLTIRLLNLI